jgi:hypothetical protein
MLAQVAHSTPRSTVVIKIAAPKVHKYQSGTLSVDASDQSCCGHQSSLMLEKLCLIMDTLVT